MTASARSLQCSTGLVGCSRSRREAPERRLVLWTILLAAALGGTSASAQFVDRILANDGTTQGNESAVGPPAITPDGRFVAFVSAASTLLGAGADTNGFRDVFVTDLTTGLTERVSVHTDGTQGNNDSGTLVNVVRADIAISDDGRYVVFTSFASTLVGVNCMAQPSQVTCDGNSSRACSCTIA